MVRGQNWHEPQAGNPWRAADTFPNAPTERGVPVHWGSRDRNRVKTCFCAIRMNQRLAQRADQLGVGARLGLARCRCLDREVARLERIRPRRGIGQELEFGGDRVLILGGDVQPAIQVGDVDGKCRWFPGSPTERSRIAPGCRIDYRSPANGADRPGSRPAGWVSRPRARRPARRSDSPRSGEASGEGGRSGRAGPLPRRCSDPGSGDSGGPARPSELAWNFTPQPCGSADCDRAGADSGAGTIIVCWIRAGIRSTASISMAGSNPWNQQRSTSSEPPSETIAHESLRRGLPTTLKAQWSILVVLPAAAIKWRRGRRGGAARFGIANHERQPGEFQ